MSSYVPAPAAAGDRRLRGGADDRDESRTPSQQSNAFRKAARTRVVHRHLSDHPNVTDKRFPGNPTRSYRTTEPVRIIEEITGWEPPPPELIQHIRERMAELAELGIEAMDD